MILGRRILANPLSYRFGPGRRDHLRRAAVDFRKCLTKIFPTAQGDNQRRVTLKRCHQLFDEAVRGHIVIFLWHAVRNKRRQPARPGELVQPVVPIPHS